MVPLNILLVEDNEGDQKITLAAFDRAKIKNRIYVVNNGKEALEFICGSEYPGDSQKPPLPDFILMDIRMPIMDGFEALKTLKENFRFNHIPVAMFTSSVDERDILKSYQYGAVTHIPKPISYEDFNIIVDYFNAYWHSAAKLPVKNDFQKGC